MSNDTGRAKQPGAALIPSTFSTAILLGLCTSCSALWQPWIDNFDGSALDAGVPTPGCDGGGAGCDTADMLPSAPPDTPPSACGMTQPSSGLRFAKPETIATRYLRGVHGMDANRVWAVGDGGTIVNWDGTRWQAQESRTIVNLFGVWADGKSAPVAVGELGMSFRLEGLGWLPYPVARNDDVIKAIWATSANNLWASGSNMDKGFVLHGNGMNIPQRTETAKGLSSIWGTDATHLWASRGDGQVEHGDGMTWTTHSTGIAAGLMAVWGSDPNNVWAVGDTGNIRKWNGSAWTMQASNTTSALLAIWGFDACNVWAVGRSGAIVWWNGSVWTSVKQPGVDVEFGGVWGSSARDLWLVGEQGTVMHLTAQ